jgi:hypothetical protein
MVTPMTEKELNHLLFAAFTLGQRVLCHAHGIWMPLSQQHKCSVVLQEVADGSTTLVAGDAETEGRSPRARLDSNAKNSRPRSDQVVAEDQELAKRVLEGLRHVATGDKRMKPDP